jgi:hypothetical protein
MYNFMIHSYTGCANCDTYAVRSQTVLSRGECKAVKPSQVARVRVWTCRYAISLITTRVSRIKNAGEWTEYSAEKL